MVLVDKVKKSLRIMHNMLDDEIDMLIKACLIDLKTAECSINENNELVQLAVITYVKANWGLDNKDSSKYYKSYMSIKNKLKIYGEDINVLQ